MVRLMFFHFNFLSFYLVWSLTLLGIDWFFFFKFFIYLFIFFMGGIDWLCCWQLLVKSWLGETSIIEDVTLFLNNLILILTLMWMVVGRMKGTVMLFQTSDLWVYNFFTNIVNLHMHHHQQTPKICMIND